MDINGTFTTITAARARDNLGVTAELNKKLTVDGAGRVAGALGVKDSTGAIANGTGGLGNLEVRCLGNADAAFMTFHRSDNFAAYFGLDTDNKFKVGGWSYGGTAYEVWHAGNFDPARRQLSVIDHGAVLNGSANEDAALSKARGAALADGVINSPGGRALFYTTPTAGPAGSVLWNLAGLKYSDGTTPIIAMGKDTVESVVNGGKYLGRGNSFANAAPVLRVDSTINHTNGGGSGTAQGVVSTQQVNMTIPKNTADIGNFGWAHSIILDSSAWGTGQHVASAALATRPADALSDSKGPRAPIWADYRELNDQTGQAANVAGPAIIGEWDLYAAGADPADQRIGHHMVFSRPINPANGAIIGNTTNARYGWGVLLDTQSYDRVTVNGLPATRLGVGFGVKMPFDSAAFDASQGSSVNGAPAFRMKEEMGFAFDAANRSQMKRIAGAVRVYFDNAELCTITDDGQLFIPARVRTNNLKLLEQSAPTGTSDTRGEVGDIIASGPYLYRKTSSGWFRSPSFASF